MMVSGIAAVTKRVLAFAHSLRTIIMITHPKTRHPRDVALLLSRSRRTVIVINQPLERDKWKVRPGNTDQRKHEKQYQDGVVCKKLVPIKMASAQDPEDENDECQKDNTVKAASFFKRRRDCRRG